MGLLGWPTTAPSCCTGDSLACMCSLSLSLPWAAGPDLTCCLLLLPLCECECRCGHLSTPIFFLPPFSLSTVHVTFLSLVFSVFPCGTGETGERQPAAAIMHIWPGRWEREKREGLNCFLLRNNNISSRYYRVMHTGRERERENPEEEMQGVREWGIDRCGSWTPCLW